VARRQCIADLPACLATCDIAILATAAPHPLVNARILRAARPVGAGPLMLADLSLPRNVDPDVRPLPSVQLIDLADLRDATAVEAQDFTTDMAATEEIIEGELRRYLRWVAGRSAAAALRQVHRSAESIAREEIARATGGAPSEVRDVVERALLRTVHRLAHGPTRRLLTAAEAGDTDLVNLLGGLFDPTAAAR